jgi:flagellar biosynthesis protein FlhF
MLLVRCGVDEDLARGLLADLLCVEDPIQLAAMLAVKIQGFAMPTVLDTRQVIAVVGPTGVGKTTTLAKLAAKFSLEQGKKVALVTADTYRIGAVEQLRTYARIMGVPLEIAISPEEVAAGVEKHQDKDVVLIDTVGRSQRSDEHLQELKAFVDAASPTETHLVIAASLAPEIQREAVEKFKMLSPTRLIITKLDESPNRGCVVNLPLSTGLGISCMTAGQNVPQDIDFADAGKMARTVLEVV